MRIENMASLEQWEKVVLHLTVSEAGELRDSLDAILRTPTSRRHEHVTSPDMRYEITVVLEDECA